MDDAIADTVVTALQIADQRAVSDLGEMLAAVATSTRETVAMQLRINAARARTYRTAQLIAGIVAFFVGLLVAHQPRATWSRSARSSGSSCWPPSPALVGVSIWAMVVLSRPARAPRLLRVSPGTPAAECRHDLGRRARRCARCRALAHRPRPRAAGPAAAGAGRRARRAARRHRVAPARRRTASGGGGTRWPARLAGARPSASPPTSPCSGARRERHALDKLGYALLFLALALVPAVLFPLLDVGVPVLTGSSGRCCSPPPAGSTPTSRCARGPSPPGGRGRSALTVYVDIVGISLAGGAGVEDALMVAARAGTGPQFERAQRHAAGRPDPAPQAVARPRRARRAGRHPAAARAGRRPSTSPPSPARGSARRCSPRPTRCAIRQLTEAEADAQKASETMGIAPALMAIAAVVLIGYPAVARFLRMTTPTDHPTSRPPTRSTTTMPLPDPDPHGLPGRYATAPWTASRRVRDDERGELTGNVASASLAAWVPTWLMLGPSPIRQRVEW